jgi:hypothetical protein
MVAWRVRASAVEPCYQLSINVAFLVIRTTNFTPPISGFSMEGQKHLGGHVKLANRLGKVALRP